MDLVAAVKKAVGLDPAEALSSLLTIWRAHRSPAIAALIEQTAAATVRTKIEGKTSKERSSAALAIARKQDAADLERLFVVLGEIRIAEAAELVAALGERSPDPRYGMLVASLLEAQPWGVSSGRKLYRALCDQAATHGDPRTASRLLAIAWKPIVKDAWAIEEMAKLVRRTVAKLTAAAPTDPPGLARACADAAENIGKGGMAARDLVAEVYAAPEDLAVRSVLADELQRIGDPRGELIALQLANTVESRRRADALLAEHRTSLLGAIAPACIGPVHFRAGFPDAVAIDVARATPLLGAREWATVRTIWQWGSSAKLPAALLALPHLRFLGGIRSAQLRAATSAKQLTGMGFDLVEDPVPVAAIGKLALEDLALDMPWRFEIARLRPLWTAPIAKRLRRLVIHSDLQFARAWLKEPLPAKLTDLRITRDASLQGWTIDASRGSDGTWSNVVAVRRPSEAQLGIETLDLVRELLDEVTDNALERLEVRFEGTRATKAEVAAIAGAAKRQRRLRELLVAGETPAPLETTPKLKDVARARAKTIARTAQDDLDAALEALPARARSEVRSLSPARVAAAFAAAKPDAAWATTAYALLALPDVDRKIQGAAIELLVRAKPAGAGARITEILSQPTGPWRQLGTELRMIPANELSTLFDWFEARKGKTDPRADYVYYAVIAAAVDSKSKAVRSELERRLKRKLTRVQTYTYRESIRGLSSVV